MVARVSLLLASIGIGIGIGCDVAWATGAGAGSTITLDDDDDAGIDDDDDDADIAAARASSIEDVAATLTFGAAGEGKTADAYAAYAALFDDSGFALQRSQDQRQVVKLMATSKNPPPATEAVLHAYRRASARLEVLIAELNDPADTELLALCKQYLSEH